MVSCNNSNAGERKRVIKTESQINYLKEAYSVNKHADYAKLAKEIGLSRKQVRDWFREEREKEIVSKIGANFSNKYANKDLIRERENEEAAKEWVGKEKVFTKRRVDEEGSNVVDINEFQIRMFKDPSVVERLEKYYKENRYPSKKDYANMVKELGLAKRVVMEWFHHRRYLERYSKAEDEEEFNASEDDAASKQTSDGFRIRRVKPAPAVQKLERYFRFFKSNLRSLDKTSIAREVGLSTVEVSRWFCTRQRREEQMRLKKREERRRINRQQTQIKMEKN